MLEKYLISENNLEIEFARNLIKKGTCFIVYNSENINRFAPSRFIGYKNNSISKHENNDEKDGRVTNPQITKIIGQRLIIDEIVDENYKKYCILLGIQPNEKGAFGVNRKYWILK